MDTYKLKFTALQLEIFRLLCIKTNKLNQREISRLLKVSPTAIHNSLNLLEKENLITINKDKSMNLKLIQLNRENHKTIELKRIENQKFIQETTLQEFLEETFPGTTIILFGSYSKGEDTIKSDIDIAIINSKEKTIDLTKFEKLLEREICLHFYNSFKEIKKELKENILSGIVLVGGIEL
ncbi:MAG: nucleotidyltransferase domain-containing protein [Nanoarchaeota archaeon]|nr:nucleotidyltransferase domain-containing protein [Nanoarchaeota archaeon]MBU1445162.1 nucleotidyltransferase domain-containing protein [Nanoarchaeota archaeon]MBU2420887.1 nucleotidyltransferase domain-containing protein [Nanoarchaeota archaeon]MBU2475358.1 nucleotidyltransferase domain-containing protein [Nanoarchaeota archaeon]MBU3940850.1 nucleotidyltransferase domain-containing protein [Nanoarchaeota archaeon]